ncbi:MAG: histidinol-phosphatase [Gammaproteobacteria bacterium]|nr:histidinol-phosphatase [Gammaproteobacteria bacterium]
MSTSEIDRYVTFCRSLLDDAGAVALKYFRTPVSVINKQEGSGFDPVTQADREVELLIRARIEAKFPDHGISGEEFSAVNADSTTSWIIDPIDGTRSFMSGMTGWGILLGLLEDGHPTIGFMCQPYLDEMWIGIPDSAQMIHKGENHQLQTSKTTALSDSVLYCTHPEMFVSKRNLANYENLADQVKLMRYGGDCYAYCLLAMGLIDIVVEDCLQPYDILPLVPIVEAAGGVVTDIHGNPPSKGGLVITAANKALHEQVISFMRR